uniref:Uncharacterized protein n=1 Tax=Timema genevievae TaxID=629358 RepID=A0A7R9K7F8_TIMGE|nr:unnamed protein product [Timema genevievae]
MVSISPNVCVESNIIPTNVANCFIPTSRSLFSTAPPNGSILVVKNNRLRGAVVSAPGYEPRGPRLDSRQESWTDISRLTLRYSSPMASLVLTDSSQLTPDSQNLVGTTYFCGTDELNGILLVAFQLSEKAKFTANQLQHTKAGAVAALDFLNRPSYTDWSVQPITPGKPDVTYSPPYGL